MGLNLTKIQIYFEPLYMMFYKSHKYASMGDHSETCSDMIITV